jgi:hypothetical protein
MKRWLARASIAWLLQGVRTLSALLSMYTVTAHDWSVVTSARVRGAGVRLCEGVECTSILR